MQNELRTTVKLLKALQGISYKEIADYLEIDKHSFYNWLKGYYNFGEERKNKLIETISLIREE